jgi:hypothetical protein
MQSTNLALRDAAYAAPQGEVFILANVHSKTSLMKGLFIKNRSAELK